MKKLSEIKQQTEYPPLLDGDGIDWNANNNLDCEKVGHDFTIALHHPGQQAHENYQCDRCKERFENDGVITTI